VNARGELVGINTFIISNGGSFAGAGFAIPSQIVRATAEQIIRRELCITAISDQPERCDAGECELLQTERGYGRDCAQVSPDSPAGRAGLKNG